MGIFNKRKKEEKKNVKAVTQHGMVLKAIKDSGRRGIENWRLSRIALKYTSVISDLRKEGHDIVATRQYDRDGKPTQTYTYHLRRKRA